MKKISFLSLLFLLITASSSIYAQKYAMEVHRGGSVLGRYNVSNIDSVTFVVYSTQIEEGVEINGIIWATRNVDAPGIFADTPEDPGMLYQWNKKVGWSSSDSIFNSDGGAEWDSNPADNSSWEVANDPCPVGWRLPSLAELQSLLDAGSSWVIQNNAVGRVFGTAPNTIFLRCAGYRSPSDGTFLLLDKYGYYWSNTKYEDPYSPFSYGMYFNSGSSGTYYHHQANGFSVRCVAE